MKRIFFLILGVLFISLITPVNAQGFGLGNTGNNRIPTIGQENEDLFKEHNVFYIGDTKTKDIYLTFDTGYENGYTPKILDTLKKTDTPATFFITGHFLKEQKELILRMSQENHTVGNHTYNHPDMTKITDEKIKNEIIQVEQEYKEITGKELDKFIRPPEGKFNKKVLNSLDKLNYTTIFWSLAFVDWKVDEQKGWEYSYNNIMNRIHNGSIILLHTVSKDNADALEKAIMEAVNK